ncbi:MAG: protein-glutamate O-methyltransferase CheR [Bacteroidales bacterium]|jgi:chemotaxis protein methyltransferase CheR|nr:protein-glutamate O-methyltransferase CheR [Bacteroidales bacterium]MDY0335184.1 protein-glutamate O-methyltransferase CheR [Bacteroidales bacterium]NLO50719.1 protein-glutamate O-methyltransferase CheR [Bacteroidales bacterium]
MKSPAEIRIATEDIEIELFLQAVLLKYGYDFRNYGKAHIKRRVRHRMSVSGLPSVSALIHKLLYDPHFYQEVLQDLSITVTEMFRDPEFYKTLRQEVVPLLKTWPFIKIWHAGCASGEEVYSMAILLHEENLLRRAQIYATDFNQAALNKARQGIYPIDRIKEYTHNYQQAGGKSSFSDYYNAHYDSVMLDKQLKENIVFADHNLVTDGVFGEMNLVVCRNVLIYFDKELQNKVLNLFFESLTPGGFLCLGSKESLRFAANAGSFEVISEKQRVYRKQFME